MNKFKFFQGFPFLCLMALCGCHESVKEEKESVSESLGSTIRAEIPMIRNDFKPFDLSDMEQVSGSEKFKWMERVKAFYPQYADLQEWPSEVASYFHFIDLDEDGDLDLIFDGWSGSEPNMVEILINRNDEFESVFREYIHLIDVRLENEILREMTIYDSGCCAAILQHEMVFALTISKDELDYELIDLITNHHELSEPAQYFEAPLSFEVMNSPYTLRITPEIDTENGFYPDNSVGNAFQTYSKGDKGFAYAEQTDTTGRVWWYVVMEPLGGSEGGIRDKDKFSARNKGWMSSRYLKKI